MGFKCGIVGLPNVGKSTLFNALTQTALADAANFPFCTIEPNVGKVSVHDERLIKLAKLANSKVVIPTQLEFVDIAGLVEGASKGEGLGNKFLSHIREVDAIVHVLRCFEDSNIIHVQDKVDPIRDIETIETELLLADIASMDGILTSLTKKNRMNKDPLIVKILNIGDKILNALKQGNGVRSIWQDLTDEEKKLQLQFCLLTAKPIMYVCNVNESEVCTGNEWTKKIIDQKKTNKVNLVSANIESEIAQLDCEKEKQEFLSDIGLKQTGLDEIIKNGYSILNLITYFTVGPKEARAWTIERETLAPQAAGVIHGDFEKGFICAETISSQEYIDCESEAKAKSLGKIRQEGRNYKVQDADVIHFLFNV